VSARSTIKARGIMVIMNNDKIE